MRILIPTLTRPHLGGAYTLLSATGKGLRQRGHEVRFVSLFGSGAAPPLRLDLVKRSDKLLSGNRGDQPHDGRTTALYYAARTALAARIATTCARRRFDAAFTIDAGATNALALLRGVFPLHTVFDVAGRLLLDLEGQGKITRGGAASRRFLREERLAYEHADIVLAYPPSFAAELRRVAPRAHLVTASTAIFDTDHVQPVTDAAARTRARESWGIPAGAWVILVPSRLVARKGVVEAVEILAELNGKGGADAHLVMAGDGPERERVGQRAAQLGLAARVHLLGGVDPPRMGEVYGMSDCVLLPAVPALGYEEPQGLTTFEALAAHRPVVASNLGGIPEVIKDEVTGLLAPPGDPRAFAAAMLCLRREPELTARLVARGAAELELRLSSHFELLEGLLAARIRLLHSTRRG